MEVYISSDHAGFYSVGTCSVVVANSEAEARRMLMVALNEHGLDGSKEFTLRRLNVEAPHAFIILDGDY